MGYRAPGIVRDRKIRFGLVGCGRISERHLDALIAHRENAELSALCDIDHEALAALGSRVDAPRGRHRLRKVARLLSS